MGWSSAFISSKIHKSRSNVFSAPTDFADAIGSHGPRIDAAGNPVVIAPCLAESLLQKRQRLRLEVRAGVDAKSVHLRRGGGPNPVELPDRQALDERRSHLGRDHEEPVRFPLIRGKLRKELVV